jgi:hypothetical protein
MNLLLLGLDAYVAEEARLEASMEKAVMVSADEQKVAAQATKTVSAKKIAVKTGEIKRFNFVNVIDTVQSAMREMFRDPSLNVKAEFINVLDDGLGVPMGYWTITLTWAW